MTEEAKEKDVSLDLDQAKNDDEFWGDMGVKSDTPISPETPKTSTETPEKPVEAIEKPVDAVMDKAVAKAIDKVVMEDKPIVSVKFTPNDLPTPKKESILPSDYKATVDSILSVYARLPKIDYDNIYQEIKTSLSVKSEPTPDAQSINQLLERIQGAKDRLSEILVDVIQSYNFKKRAVSILRDTWMNFSDAKSADKRKSESEHIVANFEIDLAFTESLFKTCDHVFKNLESLHDSVSRRITIMQVCLKYSDMGRGILPDFSFGTFSRELKSEDNFMKGPSDPSQSIDAEEQTFGGE